MDEALVSNFCNLNNFFGILNSLALQYRSKQI